MRIVSTSVVLNLCENILNIASLFFFFPWTEYQIFNTEYCNQTWQIARRTERCERSRTRKTYFFVIRFPYDGQRHF